MSVFVRKLHILRSHVCAFSFFSLIRPFALPFHSRSHANLLYANFGVDMETPAAVYKYKIKLKLSAIGFGPFARQDLSVKRRTR